MKRPNIDTPPDSTEHYASTVKVALLLGVSVTTVKRWVDDGILPAHKSPGGHRKILLGDVRRLVREGKLPQAVEAIAGIDWGLPEIRTRLDVAIDADDTEQIRGLLLGAYRSGQPIEVLADTVIAPALRRVGWEWVQGSMSVLREHRIMQAFVSALYQLNAPTQPDPNRPVALGAAPEFDHYLLPTLIAKLTLRDGGWNAVNVGPNTPFAALLAAVEEFHPRLVWVSVSHLADPERFLAEYADFYAALEARGIAVAIGGQSLTQEIRSRMRYTSFGDGCVQLAAFAKALHNRPPVPKRGRPIGKKPE